MALAALVPTNGQKLEALTPETAITVRPDKVTEFADAGNFERDHAFSYRSLGQASQGRPDRIDPGPDGRSPKLSWLGHLARKRTHRHPSGSRMAGQRDQGRDAQGK